MDHTRDNPLKRFTAFWIGLLLLVSFGIACLLFGLFSPAAKDEAYLMKQDARLEIKDGIDRASAAALNQSALSDALSKQASSFKSNLPSDGAMPVPGAAPAAAAPADAPAPEAAK